MIHSIRTSKVSKVIASYLAIQLILTTVQPTNLYALTSGPSQPEFNAFTPIGTSDMVNLSTGDFNYNIPIMDVGGYPLNLAYDSGVTMDQEASWVGLGWNLNVGQINRQVRGIPDDFKGDEMIYEQNMKDNVTVGIAAQVQPQVFGLEMEDYANASLGLGIKYNNYHGISFTPSYGLSFDLGDYVTVGMNVQTSATEGVTISPKVNAKLNLGDIEGTSVTGALNAGVSYNSNKGLSSFGLGASVSGERWRKKEDKPIKYLTGFSSTSGNLSFSNITLTPRKRTAFTDYNSTFSFSTGVDAWGTDGEIEISATATVQKIKDKTRKEKAYGYEFTGHATKNDILDYNRENDRVISKNLLVLPYTNYTYDLYSVNGQGINGMFRSHRSQIGQIYDEFVKDESKSFSLGVEATGGAGWHYGGNFVAAPSESYTGVWNTNASNTFKNKNENIVDSNLDYEPVYFKYIGENKVDDATLFTQQLKGDKAMAFKLEGSNDGYNKYADKVFRVKTIQENTNKAVYQNEAFTENVFKRTKRDVRNQSIQKITVEELKSFYDDNYAFERINEYAQPHHTAEIRVLKPDGSTYVFGETAYNIEKEEVTFSTNSFGDCASGIVEYNDPTNSNQKENTLENGSGIDHFYDKVKTPAYAHTYLLSSVLSSDYEDLTGNGPSDDDLGSYTIFDYEEIEGEPFEWRIPFGVNEASYNAGLNSNKSDQKGSYVYGKKEIKYVNKIETKTHVAIFKLSDREDGVGVSGENGGIGNGRLKQIDKILLYSKPEFEANEALLMDNDETNDPVSSIKTAYFEYDYTLCKNLPNHLNYDPIDLNNEDGKLTLKKVYFTYRNSKMGKHTPYTFDYDQNNALHNPIYSLKAFDIWGNYKPNDLGGCDTQDPLTTSEFPFVDQEDKQTQDIYANAWLLRSIGLPSGGSIDLEYESDDYQYVQDKPTMQMFKVVGVGNEFQMTSTAPESNQLLYGSNGEAKYLYIELPDETDTAFDFNEKYLKGAENKPIYFRFLMNMTKKGALDTSSSDYDYVTGYFDRDGVVNVFQPAGGSVYAAIPMRWTPLEGGLNGSVDKNPITKAGLYFGRTYLNGIVYGLNQDHRTENVVTIAKKLVSSIGAIGEIFTGPNGKLRSSSHLCAKRFIPEKSWIRLSTPKPYKLGGGSRVKQLVMNDNWDNMETAGMAQTYGQTYDYTLVDGSSSGVATFEPNDSAENPFVEPFYDDDDDNRLVNRLISPRELSYVEKPFGKAFFPYSKVTYSRVTVKNLGRPNITRHATGKVVTEFFTTKDYPTKVDFTDIENQYKSNESNVLQNIVGGIFGLPVRVKNEFALSQGFVIHTNDMDGKMRMQKVFQEGVENPISSIEYKYSTQEGKENVLRNELKVIDKSGNVSNKEIAVDYDVITDFREAYSKSETMGVNVNVAAFLLGIFPMVVPTAFPVSTKHENIAHSVITTKTVHTTAILKEKIATDLGSKVSTVNEAWDAETGQVILTKTINEFDDVYYSFNFPAYWAYSGMGQASKNLGIMGTLEYSGGYFSIPNVTDTSAYLTLGDEIMASYGITNKRLWVVEFNQDNSAVKLMNREGLVLSDFNQGSIDFKIIRSGYRNQQMGNMGAVTMMKNPIKDENGNDVTNINTSSFSQLASTPTANNPKIINASAVAYKDFWNCQCENNLPYIPNSGVDTNELADLPVEEYLFNPYRFNVKGEWRAEKSYAYLTERTDLKEGAGVKKNTRKEGYFKDFIPFYAINNGVWEANSEAADQIENGGSWTFASEVTQYSPFGAEIENKDALDRYSSAQYGYNFTLPTAVTSNSKYRYMGSDNFEDYSFYNIREGHFNFKTIVENDGAGGIEISTDRSHTGNSSLQIPNEDMAVKEVELLGVLADEDDYDGDNIPNVEDNCPYTANAGQEDYDGDGIGDVCDDAGQPIISDVAITPRLNQSCKKQKVFILNSKPNSVGYIKFVLLKIPKHKRRSSKDPGWSVHLNDNLIGHRDDPPNNRVIEISYDATGRYFGQLELRLQERRALRPLDLIVALEIQDQNDKVIAVELIDTQSYVKHNCRGEDYETYKLFDTN